MKQTLALCLAACVLITPGGCAHKRERPRRPSAIVEAPLKFVFFDLGQADAMLVLYRGRTLLMDAGESRHEADQRLSRVIGKTLEELTGKRHLDAFVLSHYHRDHVGDPTQSTGLFGLLASDGVTISTLIDRGPDIYGEAGKGETQQHYEKAIPGWLQAQKVRAHRIVQTGEQIELGEGLRIDVVSTNGAGSLDLLAKANPAEVEAYPPSENDYSVALKFSYRDFELFAGGDLTGRTIHRDFGNRREGYHDVESATAERVGDVEVYRVNHHGSDHSTNECFLSVLRPEVSIISSGENSYGHPAKKAFDRLSDASRVYITGGADQKVKAHVAASIVGGPITILVDVSGKRYSVNGKDFRAKSEEQELGMGQRVEKCATQTLAHP